MKLLTQGKTNWKYVLIVGILAIILGGGVLGYEYWWLPKHETKLPEVNLAKKDVQDETAGWKTYINNENEFEVKYPPDWFVREFDNEFGETDQHSVSFGEEFDVIEINKEKVPIYEVGFSIEIFPSQKSIQELFADYSDQFSINEQQDESIKLIDFGGKNDKAIFLTWYRDNGVPGWNDLYITKRNGFVYEIGGIMMSASSPLVRYKTKYDYNKVFNQMLSTFRFINDDSNENGKVIYEMVDRGRGFLFPEIISFENKDIKEKVNKKLMEVSSFYCYCGPQEFDSSASACDVQATVTYNSNYIFSIDEFVNFYCAGNAHDARSYDALVFDMKSGTIIDFKDLFGSPPSPIGPQINDELAGLMEKFSQNIDERNYRDFCSDGYQKSFLKNYSFSYSISEKGIAFIPQLSYAGLACTFTIVIPASEVIPFALPNSILERLIK